jgi:hypothetical protein
LADEGAGAAVMEGAAVGAVATRAGGVGGMPPVQPATVKAQVTIRARGSGKRTARC